MDDHEESSSNGVKTYYKGISFCSVFLGGNISAVDVKDGKIIRI